MPTGKYKRTPEEIKRLRCHLGTVRISGPLTEQHKENIRNGVNKHLPKTVLKKGCKPPAHAFKKGQIPWNKGRKFPQATGENNYFYGKRFIGEANPSWKGGKSFEPYTPNFNQQLKDRIRVRDNFICQVCGVPELECWRRLDVHHVDYDKKNCKEDNLTSLCIRCNARVNKDRNFWIRYFKEKEAKKASGT